MTSQAFVAESDFYVGAGIFAGGPYGCYYWCSADPFQDDRCYNDCQDNASSQFLDLAKLFEGRDQIANLDYIKGKPVWLFAGADDVMVAAGHVKKAEAFMKLAGAATAFTSVPGAHMVPTDDPHLEARGDMQEPYVGEFFFDGAGALLSHIYGELTPRVSDWSAHGEMRRFAQKDLFDSDDDFARSSFDDYGFIYIPDSCHDSACKVHINMHGCAQGKSFLSKADGYVSHAGFAQWGASNSMMIVFPQIKATEPNPFGCWDFWGYTGKEIYLTRDALQIRALRAIAEKLHKTKLEPTAGLLAFF